MTRQEFWDDVMWWGDLIDVCDDIGCDICDDVYSPERMDDELSDSIRYRLDHDMWYEVRELLEGIEWEGDECYYRKYDEWDWRCLGDDDFCAYKDDVENWMSENGCFDDDDDDDEEPEFDEYPAPPEPVEEPEIEPEPIGIAELFTISNSQLQTLKWEPEDKEPDVLMF